ncbi:MAG TPA: hypothetical protein VEP90_27335, partial [Methylomirabilota bacterium]|nr:hypothetical protein [Methylomirabilota bacterium]
IPSSNTEFAEEDKFVANLNDKTPVGKPSKNNSQKALLVLSDHPSLIPPVQNLDKAPLWKAAERGNTIAAQLRAEGIDVQDVPTKITDDTTLAGLILKSWPSNKFFRNANELVDSLDWSTMPPGSKEIGRAVMATLSDNNSVFDNARGWIIHMSRLFHGTYGFAGDIFDWNPELRQSLIESGLGAREVPKAVSETNLDQASSHGVMPASEKVEDMAGALFGQARAPIDRWFARMMFGIDRIQTQKQYEYAFGRLNFLSRMFSLKDSNILPSDIHSALWTGYQKLVSERLAAIKLAARTSKDPALRDQAQAIKVDLVSKDMAQVLRETFGLVPNKAMPKLEADTILGNDKWR